MRRRTGEALVGHIHTPYYDGIAPRHSLLAPTVHVETATARLKLTQSTVTRCMHESASRGAAPLYASIG